MNKKPTIDRIFNARGRIHDHLQQILLEFHVHGHVHVTNTGLSSKEELQEIMPALGFSSKRGFNLGGRATSSVQNKWVETNSLRLLDYYPPSHYLLPNTEVQYLKASPREVLFFVHKGPSEGSGGRIFLHPVKLIESYLKESAVGTKLLEKVSYIGMRIVTGYVDQNHPQRSSNYMKSWQEISGENSLCVALDKLSKDFLSYDRVWEGEEGTIMTSITIPGFKFLGEENYLNLPRIAATKPSFENGFREFLFGDGSSFSEEEKNILLKAYYGTQIGSETSTGDVYLFDNVKVAHSRESFSLPNEREIFVAMSGVFLSPFLTPEQTTSLFSEEILTPDLCSPLPYPKFSKLPVATMGSSQNYTTPSVEEQIKEEFSMMVYDLQGEDLDNEDICEDIKRKYKDHHILHIINNHKYQQLIPVSVLNKLGFSEKEQFKWGGKESGRTLRTSKGNGFHSVDKYPPELTLLPHQEIFYQRVLPKNMMFHYRQVSGPGLGGRTLVHSGEGLIQFLKLQGSKGEELLRKLRTYGQTIITGFLDANHSQKELNFVRSWQDRFGSEDINQALKACLEQVTHFDDCWAEESGEVYSSESGSEGKPKYMLMTAVTMPLFKTWEERDYMMFPRLAYNSPELINGMRRFIIGNGEEFSSEEATLLLKGFWWTRQGFYQAPGDILLVNNISFAHSREPYVVTEKARDAAVIMSGEFLVDPIGKKEE